MRYFLERLTQQKNDHLWRERLCLQIRQQAHWIHDAQTYLSFMNNDYLGLATHPSVINTLQKAAAIYGAGSSASPLLGGYHQSHQQLEKDIAEFTGFERALVFSTGYLANLAVIQTLIAKEDIIFEHRLNHASLIDAARVTGAKIKRFSVLEQLEKHLAQSISTEKKWIVSDAVFSMDGTLAPVPDYIALCKKYGAYLIIDDAHGIGVLGNQGAGITQHYHSTPSDITVLTGTFGKAFGGQGAFVCGNNIIIEYLLQFARSYRYSTALSPALAETNRSSIDLVRKDHWRRRHLNELIAYFKQLASAHTINFSTSMTPIQVLILKDSQKTLEVMQALKQQHILVGAIRPPTVPSHTARLRINLSALHTKKNIADLFSKLSALSL